MATLQSAVGEGAPNRNPDVVAVQTLLKQAGLYPFKADGDCGPKTKAAILKLQKGFLTHPDGRVDPNGATWTRLVAAAAQGGTITSEWSGDSSRWTQDKKLLSMEPFLRARVVMIVTDLKLQGFQPKIFFGWRSVAVQEQLFKQGNTKVHFSFHNGQKPDGTPNAYAADIVDSRWGWGDEAETNGFWAALGKSAKAHGLVWGGDWVTFKDVAHVQSRQNSELAATKTESGL